MKMFIFPPVFALAAYTHAIDSLKNVLITLGTSIGAVMSTVALNSPWRSDRWISRANIRRSTRWWQAVYFWDLVPWWRF